MKRLASALNAFRGARTFLMSLVALVVASGSLVATLFGAPGIGGTEYAQILGAVAVLFSASKLATGKRHQWEGEGAADVIEAKCETCGAAADGPCECGIHEGGRCDGSCSS